MIDQSDVSRTKYLALLKAVGHESRTFLQSVGFNKRQHSYTYALLNNHYSKTEKTFLKQKSVLVSLLPGEDNGNYLVRVE